MNIARSSRVFPENNNSQAKTKLPGIVIAVFVLWMTVSAGTVQAGGPVVCLAGAGNLDVVDFDLSTCHAPVDWPVYIELRVKSTTTTTASGYLAEGGVLTCSAVAPLSETTDCAVMVADGSIDQVQVSNSENYRLIASWHSHEVNVFTNTLPFGYVSMTYLSFSAGEIVVGSLLFFFGLFFVISTFVRSLYERAR